MTIRWILLGILMVGCSTSPDPACELRPRSYGPVYDEIGPSLDVLFVVDGTPDMEPARSRLRAEVPRLLDMLQSGVQPDGSRACPIRNIHVGVINTNLGAGSYPVPGCLARMGQNGRLIANDSFRRFSSSHREDFV